MGDHRYSLGGLTYAQLWALREAYNANFAGGVEQEGNEAERQVNKKLDRLFAKAQRHKREDATRLKPSIMSDENRARAIAMRGPIVKDEEQ